MNFLWDAFLEDFDHEIWDWSIRLTLELFWYYSQDGQECVVDRLKQLEERKHGREK
jgi:hypothetical protein